MKIKEFKNNRLKVLDKLDFFKGLGEDSGKNKDTKYRQL